MMATTLSTAAAAHSTAGNISADVADSAVLGEVRE